MSPTRRSLAAKLTRAHRAKQETHVDSASAPSVGRGSDVSVVAVPVEVAPSHVPQVGLATAEELHELAGERDRASERARGLRAENSALRQALEAAEARRAEELAEAEARSAAFVEARARAAEAAAAHDADIVALRAALAESEQRRAVAEEARVEEAEASLRLTQARAELAEVRQTARRQAEDLRAAGVAMQHHEEARDRLSAELAHRYAEVAELRAALERAAQEQAAAAKAGSSVLQEQVATLQQELAVARAAVELDPTAVAELRAELASVWAEKHELEAAVQDGLAARQQLERQLGALKQQVQHLTHQREDERRQAAAELEEARTQIESLLNAPIDVGDDQAVATLLDEAERKLSASEERRRAESARVEALERELARARVAAQDAEAGRRVAAQRAGEQRLVLDQLKRENDALRGLAEVSRAVCGAPGLAIEGLLVLLPRTLQQLQAEVEVARAEVAAREDRIRDLEIAAARSARAAEARPAPRSDTAAGSRGESLLARLRDITQDPSVSAQS